MFRILLSCAFAACAIAQPPLIYNRAILNAASFMPPGVPGGAVARGSIFSIFGTRMGPSSPTQVSSFPLGTTLANISITVSQGSTTVNAIPLYVSESQINAIMPSNAPLGVASLRVKAGNFQSGPMTVRIGTSAFGIFTATGTGLGPGILQNYVSADVQPINSATITAQPGQVITLWGTGLGAVTGGDNVAPTAGNLPTKTEVFVGGKSAAVLYSGRTPCCAGTDQIVFTVPTDAPLGCWVPVFVRTEGTGISNVVTMAIQSNASTCSDALNPLAQAIVGGQKAGGFIAFRAVTHEDVGTRSAVDVTGDYSASLAYSIGTSVFPFHPMVSLPPPGTCTVYSVTGDLLRGDPLPGSTPNGKPLDFGPVSTITGPNGTQMATSLFSSARVSYHGGSLSNNLIPKSLYLDPGSYMITGLGGKDIGQFNASFTVPQPLTWTNRDQLTVVSRSQPLALSWVGGSSDQLVGVVGFGEDLPMNASTVFACLAPPGANNLTVPANVLSNLPPTRANVLQSKSVLYLISLPRSTVTKLNASGLDAGAAAFVYISGKTVVWQ